MKKEKGSPHEVKKEEGPPPASPRTKEKLDLLGQNAMGNSNLIIWRECSREKFKKLGGEGKGNIN